MSGRRGKNRARWALLPATAMLLAVTGGPAAETPEAARPPASPEHAGASPRDAAAVGRGGVRVHLDPDTGRLLRDPAGAEGAPRQVVPGGRFSTYGGDLLEEPLADGGFKVDLRGRFQSAVVATIDPETGEAEIDCVTKPAGEEADDDR